MNINIDEEYQKLENDFKELQDNFKKLNNYTNYLQNSYDKLKDYLLNTELVLNDIDFKVIELYVSKTKLKKLSK